MAYEASVTSGLVRVDLGVGDSGTQDRGEGTLLKGAPDWMKAAVSDQEITGPARSEKEPERQFYRNFTMLPA